MTTYRIVTQRHEIATHVTAVHFSWPTGTYIREVSTLYSLSEPWLFPHYAKRFGAGVPTNDSATGQEVRNTLTRHTPGVHQQTFWLYAARRTAFCRNWQVLSVFNPEQYPSDGTNLQPTACCNVCRLSNSNASERTRGPSLTHRHSAFITGYTPVVLWLLDALSREVSLRHAPWLYCEVPAE